MSPRTSRTIKRRLERQVQGVGRVSIRTGARTATEFKARVALFDRLVEAGQLDAIRMLLAGDLSWPELRQAQRKNRLQSDTLAADVALTRPLWLAVEKTLKRMGNVAATRERYGLAFRQLKVRAADYLTDHATVADLKTVPWRELFGEMDDLSPASRNRIRSAVSAFLTVFLGDKFHPFRRAVMKILGSEREVPAAKEISVEDFWTNVAVTHEAVQPTIITLAGSGLRVGEFLQLDERAAKVLPLIPVLAGKTGAGERAIAPELLPFARQAIPCNIAPRSVKWRGVQFDARYKRLWKAMAAAAKVTGIPWSPHYLRHLYAQLATDELPSVLARHGLGHASSEMTERYATRRTTKRVSGVVGSALLKGRKGVGESAGPGHEKAS